MHAASCSGRATAAALAPPRAGRRAPGVFCSSHPQQPRHGRHAWAAAPRGGSSGAGSGNSGSSSGGSSSSSGPSTSGRGSVAACCSSSQREAAETKAVLRQALQSAIASEDYASAARIKAELTELELQDPLTGLRMALDEAVQEERYADAARLRDQIKEIEDLNKPQPPDLSGLTTSSDTLTDGVRVKVRSYYVPAQSRPELGQYFFAYSVAISNEGSRTVMLNSRHWCITDGTGKVDHVRGPGVIGEQPILEPGKSFEYQSACPLYTATGTMEGEYEMVALDEAGEWLEKLDVKIGRFALIKPETA